MAGKKIKYLLAACGLIAITLAVYAYKEYNRKPADLENKNALEHATVSLIVNEYANNEDAANKKYLGKVIQVKGTIMEVTNQHDTAFTILLGDSTLSSGVSCSVDKNHIAAAKKYTAGSIVNVKGICAGFLMDVELNRCLVIE